MNPDPNQLPGRFRVQRDGNNRATSFFANVRYPHVWPDELPNLDPIHIAHMTNQKMNSNFHVAEALHLISAKVNNFPHMPYHDNNYHPHLNRQMILNLPGYKSIQEVKSLYLAIDKAVCASPAEQNLMDSHICYCWTPAPLPGGAAGRGRGRGGINQLGQGNVVLQGDGVVQNHVYVYGAVHLHLLGVGPGAGIQNNNEEVENEEVEDVEAWAAQFFLPPFLGGGDEAGVGEAEAEAGDQDLLGGGGGQDPLEAGTSGDKSEERGSFLIPCKRARDGD